VLGAQIVAVFGFSPAWEHLRDKLCLSLSHLYWISGTVATPAALATLFVALFSFLGTGSRARSVVLLLLLPAIALYSTAPDPHTGATESTNSRLSGSVWCLGRASRQDVRFGGGPWFRRARSARRGALRRRAGPQGPSNATGSIDWGGAAWADPDMR
jgi:hypothetical protein